jgi:hypothetical protein
MNINLLRNRSEITIEHKPETIVSKREGLLRCKVVNGTVVRDADKDVVGGGVTPLTFDSGSARDET